MVPFCYSFWSPNFPWTISFYRMAFMDVSSSGSPQSTVKLLLKLYPSMSQRYHKLKCANVNLPPPSFLLPAFLDTVNGTNLHQIAQVRGLGVLSDSLHFLTSSNQSLNLTILVASYLLNLVISFHLHLQYPDKVQFYFIFLLFPGFYPQSCSPQSTCDAAIKVIFIKLNSGYILSLL